MSSRRLSRVDEMVCAALAEESLLPKEKRRRWAPYVIDCAVIRCAPPLVGGVSCPYAVVRVVAGDDGVVPGCPGGGVAVGVAADDDGIVPGRPGGGVADDGAFEDPVKRWDVADGKRGAATAVDELAHVHAPDVADGERGTTTAVDELARVHAPDVTDGERGATTAVVLVVELNRDCNEITLWGSLRVNSPQSILFLFCNDIAL